MDLTRKQTSQFPKRGLDQLVKGAHTRCAFESARGIGESGLSYGELREFGRVGRRSGRLDTDWGEPYLRSRLSLRLAPSGAYTKTVHRIGAQEALPLCRTLPAPRVNRLA